jgi:hypothetical protein
MSDYPDFPVVDLADVGLDPATRERPAVITQVEPDPSDREALNDLPLDLEFDGALCADCDAHIGAGLSCYEDGYGREREVADWRPAFLCPDGAWVCEDCALDRSGSGQP